MLFSHRDVADDLGRLFEPVWVSLRPVPQVTIDFGDGRVVRRTLHGNIATWICDAEGRALDVIPGVYTTTAYRDRLAQAALLARFVRAGGDDGPQRLIAYHDAQAARMGEALPPWRLGDRLSSARAATSKFRIEDPLEVVLEEGAAALSPSAVETYGAKGAIERPVGRALVPDPTKREAEAGPYVASMRPVAGDALLREDVKLNETERRAAVHEMLAAMGPVPFDTLTKRLYRDVLHCDLDDPWLGLGELLFGNYPFER